MPCKATGKRRPKPVVTLTKPSRSISRVSLKKWTRSWVQDNPRPLELGSLMEKSSNPAESREPSRPPSSAAGAGRFLGTRVSKARHDLRNPLSDILGFGEILEEEALAAGHHLLIPDFHAVHEAASHIFTEVNHCLNLDNIKSAPENLGKL